MTYNFDYFYNLFKNADLKIEKDEKYFEIAKDRINKVRETIFDI